MRRLAAFWGVSFRSDVNNDRLGLVWWFVEPLAHVLLVTVTALLVHGREVYGMSAFPFAVTGVMFWLTFRTALMTVQIGPGRLVLLLDHPAVNRFELMVVQSFKAFLVNSVVGGFLLINCIIFDYSPMPKNPVAFLSALLATALLGASAGFCANYAAHFYPGIRKVYAMFMRILAWTSGVFFVSEQIPGRYSQLVLWNPVLHLSQFGRSAWFPTYESVDANMKFVVFTVGVITMMGLACAVMSRRLRARAGEIA
jgi:capsular polysaccharide transport system permease protein